jgi:predicted aminopeptidase
VFHELAHQVLYVKNDTAFNESFVMVEAWRRALVEREVGSEAARADRVRGVRRRQQFRVLTRATRNVLVRFMKTARRATPRSCAARFAMEVPG